MSQIFLRVTCPAAMLQQCPFCGAQRPLLVNGMVRNPEDNHQMLLVPDKGYSYCTCYNVFYTKWENIDPTVYDDNYSSNYNSPDVDILFNNYAKRFFPILKECNTNIKSFVEIGCINHSLLDRAKEESWETFGVDINPSANFGVHDKIICDVEKLELEKKFDVIWASHIFEHFKDPLKVADNLYNSLTDNGLLFVSMPDTFFIKMKEPHLWTHWVLKEHHIMWDMERFIEMMESKKYRCLYKKHNDEKIFICSGDFHLIFQKEVMPYA